MLVITSEKKEKTPNTLKLQNFKNVLFGYCFSTIYENGRLIIFSELLNKCMDKPYLAHLLSSEYNHHVFRLLTDCVCLYTYEFWLSLWKIVRSSVILLLPLLITSYCLKSFTMRGLCALVLSSIRISLSANYQKGVQRVS
jgi:hypothetical protein